MIYIRDKALVLFPTKCYTTSLSAFFSAECAINISDVKYGKHSSLIEAEKILSFLGKEFVEDLDLVLPIRHPKERILSIYSSHKKVEFDNTNISSANYNIYEYFNSCFALLGYDRISYFEYINKNKLSQIKVIRCDKNFLKDLAGVVNSLKLNIRAEWVNHLNESPKILSTDSYEIDDQVDLVLSRFYPQDKEIYEILIGIAENAKV
jgi:hypothetical protein